MSRYVFLVAIVLGGLVALSCPASCEDDAAAAKLKFFENSVRPLLVEHCYKCHANGKVQGGFQFGSIESLRKGGESGEVVLPGNPDDSLLISAVRYDLLEMPPDGQLKPDQIKTLEKWIQDGAVWPATDKSPRSVRQISDKDREWWSFQPVTQPAIPTAGEGWARNAIDQFVAKGLAAAELQPAPQADRRTLIRRLYYDLVGLPPTYEEVEAFVADPASDAYDKLVNRLLDSPAYGERWGRHWLDLVRYSESDGYRKDDFRPDLWRYRDYVIRSFNSDKPYTQFIAEQIAGDEIDPDNPEARVATALWRLYLYEYNQRDVRTHWTAILDEMTDVGGEVFLGLSLGCAKCHDHKFDPILRKDYFRFQAYFSSILPQDKLPIATPADVEAHRIQQAKWEAATLSVRAELDELMKSYRKAKWVSAVEKFPPDIRVIAKSPPESWSALDRQLMDLVDRQVDFEYTLIKFKEEEQKKYDELQKQLAEFDSIKPQPLPISLTVIDAGTKPAETYIPGSKRDILPGHLTVLNEQPDTINAPSNSSTGRRTALAEWLTDKSNPLTHRVITNRIWQYHFGSGLVSTSSDFGTLGEMPSHPELLDWLTTQFVDSNWSFKQMHRLMVSSATYRVAAVHPDAERAKLIDPLNRLRWRWDVRRLDAEQIRDSMLQVSGELKPELGGEPVAATLPRRSVYTVMMRNTPDPFLSSFDSSDGFNSTPQRGVTTTPTQSLLMINGEWSQNRAERLAVRIDTTIAATGSSQHLHGDAVRAAWQFAFGRLPSDVEQTGARQFLENSESLVAKNQSPLAQFKGTNSKAAAFGDAQPPHQWTMANTDPLPTADFTVEAVIELHELYKDASVRTVVSQWSGDTKLQGWNLGVTSDKSGFKPRNLILQLVGDADGQPAKYEAIASNLRPELNRPYYVAVVVKIGDEGESGVTFYLKDLADPKSVLQTAQAKHTVKGNYLAKNRLVIGGRDVSTHHRWNGLIDNVRISRVALEPDELLISGHAGGSGRDLVAFWTFDTDQPGSDQSENRLSLTVPENKSAPLKSGIARHALVDLAHVLLNSNEFLYVD